jgi:hypothetical protein
MSDHDQREISTPRHLAGGDVPNPGRRKFLIGAAITATAATVGVGVGTVEARGGISGLIRPISQFHGQLSQQITSSMCFEDTGYSQVLQFTVNSKGQSQPGSFFIWFTARNVPAGTYTISITPDPGDATTPFRLASGGNNGFLFVESLAQAADCPTSTDPNPASPTAVSHTADGVSPFTLTATHDVQLKVHVDYSGGALTGPTTFTFNGSIKSGANTLSSSSVTVAAKPK